MNVRQRFGLCVLLSLVSRLIDPDPEAGYMIVWLVGSLLFLIPKAREE